MTDYALRPRKVSAQWQFYIGAQMEVKINFESIIDNSNYIFFFSVMLLHVHRDHIIDY